MMQRHPKPKKEMVDQKKTFQLHFDFVSLEFFEGSSLSGTTSGEFVCGSSADRLKKQEIKNNIVIRGFFVLIKGQFTQNWNFTSFLLIII